MNIKTSVQMVAAPKIFPTAQSVEFKITSDNNEEFKYFKKDEKGNPTNEERALVQIPVETEAKTVNGEVAGSTLMTVLDVDFFRRQDVKAGTVITCDVKLMEKNTTENPSNYDRNQFGNFQIKSTSN